MLNDSLFEMVWLEVSEAAGLSDFMGEEKEVGDGEAFFGLPRVGLPTKVASSNGRHLKSFLYPPQVTLLLEHCWQVGFVSSHFSLFALQVMQPLRLLDCFRLVMPLASVRFAVALVGCAGGRR